VCFCGKKITEIGHVASLVVLKYGTNIILDFERHATTLKWF